MFKKYIKLSYQDSFKNQLHLEKSFKTNYSTSSSSITKSIFCGQFTKKIVLILLLIFMMIFLYSISGSEINVSNSRNITKSNFNPRIFLPRGNNDKGRFLRSDEKQPGYLVYEKYCKIPNVDPFDPNIMKNFEKRTYNACSQNRTLSFISFSNSTLKYELHFHVKMVAPNERLEDWYCCYKEITRPVDPISDDSYKISNCNPFNGSVLLETGIEYILVKCENFLERKIYENVHSMIPEKIEVLNRIEASENNYSNPISVLMIGIDSMSRANILRGMPNTLSFLYGYEQQWFDMQGYNKVGDNTLPNLMPILTGYNLTSNKELCNGSEEGGLDKCPFIWKDFKKYGFATAYAEDDFTGYSTFNYLQKGFWNQPVDFYLRPLIVATKHELKVAEINMQSVCVGMKHQSEYVLDYSLEFIKRFRNKPYFGLFWFNLFSHDGFDFSSEMDTKMLKYFKELKASGVMDKTIVIFFSDHGMRWGKGNNFYEERLPFLYIWLPTFFREKYPKIVESLTINQNRLINPFDLHMTLKNIIEISGRVEEGKKLEQSKDCLKCQSLFNEIPSDRTCKDIEIEDHWCTCNPFEKVDVDKEIVREAGNFVVEYINDLIANHKDHTVRNLCLQNITLQKVEEAFRILPLDNHEIESQIFRIVFTIEAVGHKENGKYFTTVNINFRTEQFEISGDISRLNEYAEDAKCISVWDIKKFCFCS